MSNKIVINSLLGIGFLVSLLLIKLISFATTKETWFFGRKFHIGCLFKDLMGFDCPTCGMTRSVILTLQGELQSAFQMHIGGSLFIFGILSFSLFMILSAIFPNSNLERKIIIVSTAYFASVTLISFGFWILKINS